MIKSLNLSAKQYLDADGHMTYCVQLIDLGNPNLREEIRRELLSEGNVAVGLSEKSPKLNETSTSPTTRSQQNTSLEL